MAQSCKPTKNVIAGVTIFSVLEKRTLSDKGEVCEPDFYGNRIDVYKQRTQETLNCSLTKWIYG